MCNSFSSVAAAIEAGDFGEPIVRYRGGNQPNRAFFQFNVIALSLQCSQY
jgi:hypothetical protein